MRKLAAVLAIYFALSIPGIALAQFSAEDSGLIDTGNQAYGETNAADLNLATFIGTKVIQPVLGILGLIFFVLMIYAGFLWMTAAGDEKKVSKAKEILRAAVIGAVIILGAYALTASVFNALENGSFVTSGGATTTE